MFKASCFVFNLKRCCDVDFFLWGQNTKEVEMEFEQKSLVFWVVWVMFSRIGGPSLESVVIPESVRSKFTGAPPTSAHHHYVINNLKTTKKWTP